jgi:basic membrane lipoprotein Med (substrate-binding protein (PBP1-ABC) superfamily)
VIFTGDWSMPVKEAEATNSLIDQGVDVLTCHVDGPKTMVENAARREVAAVQGRTNANLAAGYGFTGILVAFLARQNPLAIIPVAVLLGGISASGGLLQRRLGLPDASVQVLQGIIFVFVLASDALYGRLGFLRGRS